MSTDLELCQELPKIKVSSIRVRTAAPPPQISAESAGSGIQNRRAPDGGEEEADSSESPRTPTSEEHRIPAPVTCPPAPRKPKRAVVPCKRKLSELKFFEIANSDEVDSFFRSSFAAVSILDGSSAKRSCFCSCK